MKRASETPHNNDILKLFSHMEATLIFFSRGRTGVLSREWMSNWNLLFLKKNAIKYRLMYNIDDDVGDLIMMELRSLLLLNWPRPCVEYGVGTYIVGPTSTQWLSNVHPEGKSLGWRLQKEIDYKAKWKCPLLVPGTILYHRKEMLKSTLGQIKL